LIQGSKEVIWDLGFGIWDLEDGVGLIFEAALEVKGKG
jgi:hypothetical protein